MWEINTADQLLTISVFLIYGIVSCLCYDFLRALRKAGSNSFVAVTLGDILFFTVSAFIFFFLLLARTCGEIRGYVFLCAAAGFFLCRITISRITFPAISFLVGTVCRLSRFISLKISLLCAILMRFVRRTATKIINVFKDKKKCLKNGGKVLYNKGNLLKGGEDSDGRKA